ncbi:MAG: hypothetical protein V7607_2269 [Solirubrobacteraceae bacterium]
MFVIRPADAYSYAYLLGMYLGDGHLVGNGRSWQLVVSLDSEYEEIVEECRAAMLLTLPSRIPRLRTRQNERCVRVASMAKAWHELFPQHGRGRKHERPIVLEPWQREIAERETWQFVRGLIHSDGCRSVNRFKTKLPSGRLAEYAYPRYFLSNLSPDIRGLFCEACDRLGLRWTQSSHRNISISHRASVALLDEFVGPKR